MPSPRVILQHVYKLNKTVFSLHVHMRSTCFAAKKGEITSRESHFPLLDLDTGYENIT